MKQIILLFFIACAVPAYAADYIIQNGKMYKPRLQQVEHLCDPAENMCLKEDFLQEKDFSEVFFLPEETFEEDEYNAEYSDLQQL